MINHIEGKLIEKNPTYVIIECGGVGYFINITISTYSKIENTERCKLFTHIVTNQQDFSQSMYGFFDEQERNVFRHLISVSGVGASTARMVLSSLSPAEVQSAVAKGDVATFRSIKGIGEKTAQRIIVDLSGKLTPLASSAEREGEIKLDGQYNKYRAEALGALLTLGFAKNIAEKAINKALAGKANVSVEELVKDALKNI